MDFYANLQSCSFPRRMCACLISESLPYRPKAREPSPGWISRRVSQILKTPPRSDPSPYIAPRMVFRLGRDPVSFRTMKCVVLTIHHAFPNPSSTIASSLFVELLAAPLNPHLSRRHHITPSPSLSGCMLLQQWWASI
jgi:hypothetical protein